MSNRYFEFKSVEDNVEVSIRQNNVDLTIDELGEILERFLIAAGFHPNSVSKIIHKD